MDFFKSAYSISELAIFTPKIRVSNEVILFAIKVELFK